MLPPVPPRTCRASLGSVVGFRTWHAYTPPMRSCPQCGEANPDRASSASPAAPRSARLHDRETRKTVTVLFSDLVGSTELGERLDPESIRRVMSRYFEAMQAVLERHGGTVEKFIGDAVMAVFGIPSIHEDDALRALRAAQRCASDCERSTTTSIASGACVSRFASGWNTGEVIAGDPVARSGVRLGRHRECRGASRTGRCAG